MSRLVSGLNLDELGRVVIEGTDLDDLSLNPDLAIAGGNPNSSCTNSVSCGGSYNGSCNNQLQCEYSSNGKCV
jgi:hypothetical protein